MATSIMCCKCGRTKAEANYYTYKNGARAEMCKDCMTMHINTFEPDTFLWLLEKFDVPYIPGEWNILRDRAYAKDPKKMNSVFGKYLSKMKLKQWKQYTWADSERLCKEAADKAQIQNQMSEELKANIKESYEKGEISEAQYKTYITSAPDSGEVGAMTNQNMVVTPYGAAMPPQLGVSVLPAQQVVDIGADLTDEDRTYLSLKWGANYSPAEWVSLEQLYEEFMNSFDIQSAATVDTLKLLCKTSLKMNQAIDCSDIDSYQKLSRVYDSMMKAGKFTEAQNKDGKEDDFDAAGTIVAFAEKEGGYIPKHEIKVPFDKVDIIINDLKEYTRSLIYNDSGLAQQIEAYLKKKEIAEEQKKDREKAKEEGLDAPELTDEDWQNYHDSVQEQKELDEAISSGKIEDEDIKIPIEEWKEYHEEKKEEPIEEKKEEPKKEKKIIKIIEQEEEKPKPKKKKEEEPRPVLFREKDYK